MLGIFYGEDDKAEIRRWIKKGDDNLLEEIRRQLNNFVTLQYFAQYDAEFRSRIEIFLSDKLSTLARKAEVDSLQQTLFLLQQDVDALKRRPTPVADTEPLQQEIATLRRDIDALKRRPTPVTDTEPLRQAIATLQQYVAALQQEVAVLKRQQPPPVDDSLRQTLAALQQEVATLKQQPSLADELAALRQEIADLRQANANMLREIESLKSKPSPTPQPLPQPEPPEKIFFLPECTDVFISNERATIPAQIRRALEVGDIEAYLSANPSDTGKKFLKLISTHVREVKKFVDKLKLDNLEDEELSETVTTKYFKLFQRTIFDNLIIAIQRGLKTSDNFYSGLLEKVNEYLARCGIYTLNVKSGRKVEGDDYDNMTPQVLKTTDANLAETINEIERLPYRINYLDEFGEQKYFQYLGIMSIYKAVQS